MRRVKTDKAGADTPHLEGPVADTVANTVAGTVANTVADTVADTVARAKAGNTRGNQGECTVVVFPN